MSTNLQLCKTPISPGRGGLPELIIPYSVNDHIMEYNREYHGEIEVMLVDDTQERSVRLAMCQRNRDPYGKYDALLVGPAFSSRYVFGFFSSDLSYFVRNLRNISLKPN